MRRSEAFRLTGAVQDLNWPEKPDYNNPIVAILNKNNDCFFNFQLKNGEKASADDFDKNMVTHRIDPDGIKKMVGHHFGNNDYCLTHL